MAYRRTEAGQARLDAQRARIVAAATYLLAAEGYAGCSVAAVAERAGVSIGTVYNHVPGKVELVAEVFERVVVREVDAVRSAVEGADGAPAQVAAVVETFARRALRSRRLAYVLLAEPVAPAVEELRLRFRLAFREIVDGVIARGVAAGELPAQNSAVAAAAIVGAIAEAVAVPSSARTCDQLVPALVTFCLRSTGARDAAHA